MPTSRGASQIDPLHLAVGRVNNAVVSPDGRLLFLFQRLSSRGSLLLPSLGLPRNSVRSVEDSLSRPSQSGLLVNLATISIIA
jgi:hypothetical protein